METTQIAKKISLPTIRVVAIALAIELFSILAAGKSPAYMSTAQIFGTMSINFGYYALILSLISFPLFFPVLAVSFTLNQIAFRVVSWPFRKIRFFRMAWAMERRRKYVKAELARNYANVTQDEDLLKKLDKREKALSKPESLLTATVFVLFALIVVFSSQENPNFLMKVCSIDEPVQICAIYTTVIILAFIQSILIMALYGFLFWDLFWFPLADLPVSKAEILKHSKKASRNSISEAMEKWMRGHPV